MVFLHMVFIVLLSPLLQKFMGEMNFTETFDSAGQIVCKGLYLTVYFIAVTRKRKGSSLFYAVIFF